MSAPADPGIISRFLAKQIQKGAPKGAPEVEDLAKAISEIELQTQILGASFIKVHVIDPEWAITTSGWLEVVEGLVHPIEVEFPEKSGWFWRLCAIDGTTDRTQPTLTLTFEDRIVAYLRDYWGPLAAPPGTTTRAQFIRDLVREVGHHGEPPINFRCKAINTVQEVEPTREEKFEKLETTAAKATTEAKANKSSGVSASSSITIKGVPPTATQVTLINEVLSIANGLHAPPLAVEALIEACITENGFTNNPGGGGGSTGLLQLIPSTAAALGVDPLNVSETVTAFLTKTQGHGTGGAIGYATAHPTAKAYEVAQAVQASGAGEESNGASNYGATEAEAKAIIHAGGGVTGAATGASTAETASDVGQLTRGTIDNPDEDSWECSTRIAQQVTWFLYSDGNSLFYMTGPEMVAQRPALHVNVPSNKITRANGQTQEGAIQTPLTYTFDNTTFEYRRTHKVKSKVQRRSKASKPSTPAEVRWNLECAITDFRAGEVIEFQGSGPINGRWIIADATRNCLKDIFTQLILQPPIEPLPEPKATTGGESTTEAISTPASTEGYVNPFSRINALIPRLIDQGVDLGGTGPLLALGDGTITTVVTSTPRYEGGAVIILTLESGPYAGKATYWSEAVTPSVTQGQKVKAGQVIGQLTAGGEFGWAVGGGSILPLAENIPGSGNGTTDESCAGASFNKLLVKLGCQGGIKQSGGPHGTMPPGYP